LDAVDIGISPGCLRLYIRLQYGEIHHKIMYLEPTMNLENAISAHAEWKAKLRTAILKEEQLDADAISLDDRCPLGQWLHGDGKAQYGRMACFGPCVTKHAEFHKSAGSVAKTINAHKYTEAQAMLAARTPFSEASNALGVAIILLRREARI
jgi:methyl-accepting chemotaxis protein